VQALCGSKVGVKNREKIMKRVERNVPLQRCWKVKPYQYPLVGLD